MQPPPANKRKRARLREQRLKQEQQEETISVDDDDDDDGGGKEAMVVVEADGDLDLAPGRGFLTGREAERAAEAFRTEEAVAVQARAAPAPAGGDDAAASSLCLFGLLRPVPGRWCVSIGY
jgi:hypothetical protein